MATVNRKTVSFSKRIAAAAVCIVDLERQGFYLTSMTMSHDQVCLILGDSPRLYSLKGDPVKIIGGPAGMFQLMEKRIGIVHVQWLLPYTHQAPLQLARVH